jgi:hypothetical protein
MLQLLLSKQRRAAEPTEIAKASLGEWQQRHWARSAAACFAAAAELPWLGFAP